MFKRPSFLSKPLSMYHPRLLKLAIALKVLDRQIEQYLDKYKYAYKKDYNPFPYRIKKHKSLLLKKLGSSDMYLQYNKIDNLKIVVKSLNGIVIKPGETFSYFKILGKPTKRRGFNITSPFVKTT